MYTAVKCGGLENTVHWLSKCGGQEKIGVQPNEMVQNRTTVYCSQMQWSGEHSTS